MGPFAPIFYSIVQKILMGILGQKISGKISLTKYEQGFTNTGYLKIRVQNCNFLVAPFLENGATYLLSTVSVGLYVCMSMCVWTVRIIWYNIFSFSLRNIIF